MDITLLTFITAGISALFFFKKTIEDIYNNGYFGGFMASLVLCMICFVVCVLEPSKTVDFPVEYKVFPTDTEIICYVGDKKYVSEKKKDFDTWTQNKPGFLIKKYNHFGFELKDSFGVK